MLRETLNVDAIPFLQKLGPNMISMFIVFGLLYWTGMARMVRGQILTIKQNEYVLAAKISGAKSGRIIRRHILPNCVSVIIVAGALQIPSAIFTESFLSFIGLGVQAPMPSLGSVSYTHLDVYKRQMLVDKEMWPMPSYGDLLFEV